MVNIERLRTILEESLILIGVLGIIFVFQPIYIALYSLGWYMILFATLAYVVFTIVPADIGSGKKLVVEYFKVLLIILIVVAVFILFSVYIAPHMVY